MVYREKAILVLSPLRKYGPTDGTLVLVHVAQNEARRIP
jgi:hypothetical protein